MKKEESSKNEPQVQEYDPFPQKPWTFMFYNDADFDKAYDPNHDFSQTMYAGENLHVIVLQDRETAPANIWYVENNKRMTKLKSEEELNMGDPNTLQNFVDYAKRQCPAERYLIAFYNHGGGWKGACWDKSHGDDPLKMDEIKQGLTNSGGVDIVLFTAPCLMGALESVYELRNCTDVYIGSEDLSGYCWWMDNTMLNLRNALEQSPDINIYQLAEQVIGFVYNDHAPEWDRYLPDLTMSAIRTDRIRGLADAIDKLSISYNQKFEDFRQHMNLLYKDILSFYDSNIDVFDFADKLLLEEKDEDIKNELEKVKESLTETVIASCNGDNRSAAHGLTIYFPSLDDSSNYNSNYGNPDYGLDFSEDTQWDELLNKFFQNLGQITNQHPLLIYVPYLNAF
jgi:hypothetical protein